MEYLFVVNGLIAVAGVFAAIQNSAGKKPPETSYSSRPMTINLQI
jgi:hypothetical protein